jgi:hypothetical protein
MRRLFDFLFVSISLLGCVNVFSQVPVPGSLIPKLTKTHGTGLNDNVQCALQDKTGNLWFGTTGEGVYMYDGRTFKQFTAKDGLAGNTIWSMLEDKRGHIWFGTDSGVCKYTPQFNGIKRVPIEIPGGSLPKDYPERTNWSKSFVLSMLEDRHGVIWLGTGGGVYRFEPRANDPIGSEPAFSYFYASDGVTIGGIHLLGAERMLEDKAGNIWFGGRGIKGVYRYDGKYLTNFHPDGDNWLRPLIQDKKGNIWFGSRRVNVYRYDNATSAGTFTPFAEKEITDWVFNMVEDRSRNLWFSSGRDSGVTRYDGTRFVNFTTRDGLYNNSVWSILEDSAGNIWFGTKNVGLCRYDGKSFLNFSE